MTVASAEQGLSPLQPEWLLEPLPSTDPAAPDLEVADSRFESISALILRGEYVKAGHESETMLNEGVRDVRVFGYYLFGAFIERGLPSLPLVFRALIKFLGQDLETYGPRNKKQIQTENMLLWLLSGVLKNAELHSTLKDSTWKQWLDPKNRPALDEAMLLCPQVQVALANFAPQSRAALRFQSLDGWLGGLSHSETGVTKRSGETNAESKGSKESPKAETAEESNEKSRPRHAKAGDDDDHDPDDDEDDEDQRAARLRDEEDEEDEDAAEAKLHPLDDEDDDDDLETKGGSNKGHLDRARNDLDEYDPEMDEHPGRHQRPASERGAANSRSNMETARAPSPAEGSALWQRLLERLQAFEALVAQGQYLKAAVVATDIQAAVSSFDPVAYFPGLFAPYLTSFAEHMRPLEHYLNDSQAVKFRILRQLYQVDFDKFMRKD